MLARARMLAARVHAGATRAPSHLGRLRMRRPRFISATTMQLPFVHKVAILGLDVFDDLRCREGVHQFEHMDPLRPLQLHQLVQSPAHGRVTSSRQAQCRPHGEPFQGWLSKLDLFEDQVEVCIEPLAKSQFGIEKNPQLARVFLWKDLQELAQAFALTQAFHHNEATPTVHDNEACDDVKVLTLLFICQLHGGQGSSLRCIEVHCSDVVLVDCLKDHLHHSCLLVVNHNGHPRVPLVSQRNRRDLLLCGFRLLCCSCYPISLWGLSWARRHDWWHRLGQGGGQSHPTTAGEVARHWL
mmetsp:Transcript_10187/g.24445  ORF Transcript_10187/g.24445 Transcript_10187/m.24445 type:complete len:298 (-) Transcript_10187:1432-2325(-)